MEFHRRFSTRAIFIPYEHYWIRTHWFHVRPVQNTFQPDIPPIININIISTRCIHGYYSSGSVIFSQRYLIYLPEPHHGSFDLIHARLRPHTCALRATVHHTLPSKCNAISNVQYTMFKRTIYHVQTYILTLLVNIAR